MLGSVNFADMPPAHGALYILLCEILHSPISHVLLFVAANNDRARYSSGRGGYRNDRNDSFRGRGGNFGGSRGYVSRNDFEKRGGNDFEKRGEFSGRPRGGNNNTGRSNGDSVPRSYQNGVKVPRQPVKVQ